MSIRCLVLCLSFWIVAFGTIGAQQERLTSAFGEMYPAGSGRFSRDEERAIAVANTKLLGGGQKRLDAFYKVIRKGKEFWVLALVTGRPKWGQEGFENPALFTVVVSPKWTVSRVMSGWHQ
ncbi:MAG TPA: hypothetical protein VJU77_03555 [Chthoniobacterales bacterium]|nr:hypothetical protein [Chthoniobacterales bacterium]